MFSQGSGSDSSVDSHGIQGDNDQEMIMVTFGSGEIEEETTYEVEKILTDRPSRMMGSRQYLVHWKDYDASHDSWVDEDQLLCPDLLREYKKKKAQMKRRASNSRSQTPYRQKRATPICSRGSTPLENNDTQSIKMIESIIERLGEPNSKSSTEYERIPVPNTSKPASKASTPVPRANTPVLKASTLVAKASTPVPMDDSDVNEASSPQTKHEIKVFPGRHPDANIRAVTELYIKQCYKEKMKKRLNPPLNEPWINEYIPGDNDIGLRKGWQAEKIIRRVSSTHVSVRFKEESMYQIIPLLLLSEYRMDLYYKLLLEEEKKA